MSLKLEAVAMQDSCSRCFSGLPSMMSVMGYDVSYGEQSPDTESWLAHRTGHTVCSIFRLQNVNVHYMYMRTIVVCQSMNNNVCKKLIQNLFLHPQLCLQSPKIISWLLHRCLSYMTILKDMDQ